MLVSVIVPVYNVENFLAICVNSILSQTLSDLELILINDGSKDESGKICDQFAAVDSRIIVVHQDNIGQSLTRNKGIEMARGEYIAFVDSDDFIQPHYLENLYRASVSYDADLVVCDNMSCRESDSLLNVKECNLFEGRVFEDDKMDCYFKTGFITNTVWGKLYRQSLIKNFRFPNRKYCEDVYSSYTMVHEARRVFVSNYKGYVYRNNSSSVMNEKYTPQKKDGIAINLERAAFVKKYYPHLVKYAYRGVIYSCNQVLLCMGKSRTIEENSLGKIQTLYRKYIGMYLRSKVSLTGKLFAMISFVSVRLGLLVARFL